jgi:hypothetical protein
MDAVWLLRLFRSLVLLKCPVAPPSVTLKGVESAAQRCAAFICPACIASLVDPWTWYLCVLQDRLLLHVHRSWCLQEWQHGAC